MKNTLGIKIFSAAVIVVALVGGVSFANGGNPVGALIPSNTAPAPNFTVTDSTVAAPTVTPTPVPVVAPTPTIAPQTPVASQQKAATIQGETAPATDPMTQAAQNDYINPGAASPKTTVYDYVPDPQPCVAVSGSCQ